MDAPRVLHDTDIDPIAASEAAQKILAEANEPEDDKAKGIIDVPFIAPPPDTTVKLPGGGLLDADGTINDEVEVKELNGADEEALSKAEVTKNLGRYIQALVKRGTVRIGRFEKLNDDLLGELLIGDREMLILSIRRATYGDELEMAAVCPVCASAVDVTFDLATEIPITVLEDPRQRSVDMVLRDGRKAVVRIPTAGDQNAIYALTGKTMSEMNTLLIGRCLVTIDGMPASGQQAALSLGIHDRREIVKVMNDIQPGPKYSDVEIECPGCGGEFPLQVRLLDLFRG